MCQGVDIHQCSFFSQPPFKLRSVIPLLQMKKLRLREVKQVSPDHKAERATELGSSNPELSWELFRAYIILFQSWMMHFSKHILNSNNKSLQVCWIFPDPGSLSVTCISSGSSVAPTTLQKHPWNFQSESSACWSHWHDPRFTGVHGKSFSLCWSYSCITPWLKYLEFLS